jgi:hypothetical protein
MANPVLITDLEARFRPLSPAERTTAQALLDDAWAILLTRRPGLVQHMEEDAVSTATVRAVVAAMIVRVLRNPEGWVTEAVDDWSGRRGESAAAGSLYVSDAELALLAPGGVGDGAFTIRPMGVRAASQPPDPWLPYGYGATLR